MIAAVIALIVSIALAAALLTRQRMRARPDDYDPGQRPPGEKPGRRERILEQLEPLPELPTVMDLMRQEIAELGVDKIPGSEGLAGPVLLKVYKRDQRVAENCPREALEYVVADGVAPAEATEDDVVLSCKQHAEDAGGEESGTDSED